jgi:hypothetical protein
MRIFSKISILGMSAALAALTAFGAGEPAKAAAGKPDETTKKVWTNEDVAQLNPDYVPGAPKAAEIVVIPSVVVTPEGPKVAEAEVATAVAPEQNPAWYGAQIAELQAQADAVAAREDELRNFRATGAGIQTGLILNAPCTGISTDNLIANLDAERQAILAKIDALQDAARSNGLAPGQLVAPAAAPLSPSAQRAAIAATVENASAQIAGIQSTEAGMQQQVADLGGKLQQPTPGWGGNPTTDLLNRLNSRAAELQGTIDSAEDASRTLGANSR